MCWLPLGRLRKWLHLASFKIRLEIGGDLVLSWRDEAEGVRPVFVQRVADVIRLRITVFTVHCDTATILVGELRLVS